MLSQVKAAISCMEGIRLSIKSLDYTLDPNPYIVLVQQARSSFDKIFDSLYDDEFRGSLSMIKQTRETLNSTILELQDIKNSLSQERWAMYPVCDRNSHEAYRSGNTHDCNHHPSFVASR